MSYSKSYKKGMFGIPGKSNNTKRVYKFFRGTSSPTEKLWSVITFFLGSVALLVVIGMTYAPVQKFVSPLISSFTTLKPLNQQQNKHEVFGFAPYWTIHKLDSVDFSALTTFAYFGVPITEDGSLDKEDQGYRVFKSDYATAIFKKAHTYHTRVVLTVTIMDNDTIEQFLADPQAQQRAVHETIREVKNRGIDGINVDVEYIGTPSELYRNQFTHFVSTLTTAMHDASPNSRVTVSVYASSARGTKLYDIAALGKIVDGIFMMAYDFAVRGSDTAMPTAPLYGFKEGKYSYDIATAVDDFLKLMPAEKLILGVPYYGYNYLIYGQPQVKADTRPSWSWRGSPMAQTYIIAQTEIAPEQQGWDEIGQVGWKAYYVAETDTWRMIFLDDARSLGIKYDFAKNKNLQGVGIWALGFDHGRTELWSLLKEKFGTKNLADSSVRFAEIN